MTVWFPEDCYANCYANSCDDCGHSSLGPFAVCSGVRRAPGAIRLRGDSSGTNIPRGQRDPQGMSVRPVILHAAVPTGFTRCCLAQALEVRRERVERSLPLVPVSLAHSTSFAAFLAKVDAPQKGQKSAQQRTESRRTSAAVLALVAGILTSINAAGGFADKWKANRDARSRLESVRLDLRDPAVPLPRVRDSVRLIIRSQSDAISRASAK